MWWQDQVAVFYALDWLRDFPIFALAMVIDLATGFTARFTRVLRMEGQRDAMLLSLILLLAMSFHDLGDSFRTSFSSEILFPDLVFHPTVAAKLAMQRQMGLYHLEVWLIYSVVVASALGSAYLARRQKRSVPLWLVLGYFGNLGSVIWLLVRRSDACEATIRAEPVRR